jgi:hypothetical protein
MFNWFKKKPVYRIEIDRYEEAPKPLYYGPRITKADIGKFALVHQVYEADIYVESTKAYHVPAKTRMGCVEILDVIPDVALKVKGMYDHTGWLAFGHGTDMIISIHAVFEEVESAKGPIAEDR